MNTDVLSSYVKCYICPFLNVFDVGRQIMVEISKLNFMKLYPLLVESFIKERQRDGVYTALGLTSSLS